MTTQIDLRPAAERMARVVDNIADDDLTKPTPCEKYTVGDLLDHLAGGALAFRAAAVKEPLGQAPPGDVARLGPDWRTRIPADVRAAAEAWQDKEAWEGMTAVGGIDLPGEVAAMVALDEFVVHGWDLAKATGQPPGYDGPELEAVHQTVLQFRQAGLEGIFGAEVQVDEGAPLFDRVLGVTGREPNWRPPTP